MIIRVRNMQPVGGSALPVGRYLIEPGWTSPVMDVEEGTPLDEIINSWVEDGIAMVLPSEDEGGIVGPVQKKRKTMVLNLVQAQNASMKRGDMRRTSLDAAYVPDAPKVPRRASGNSTIRKSSILTLKDIKGKSRTELAYKPGEQLPEVDKEASVEIPDEATMAPLPPADAAEDVAKNDAPVDEPVIDNAPEEDVIEDSGEEDAGEVDTTEDQDLAEEKAAKEREKNFEEVKESLASKSKNSLMKMAVDLEKAEEGLDLEIKAAMLKADVVETLAYYLVSRGFDAKILDSLNS